MNPDKARGIDGFTPGFYQKGWPILGNDVVKSVMNFFRKDKLSERLNDTLILERKKKTQR